MHDGLHGHTEGKETPVCDLCYRGDCRWWPSSNIITRLGRSGWRSWGRRGRPTLTSWRRSWSKTGKRTTAGPYSHPSHTTSSLQVCRLRLRLPVQPWRSGCTGIHNSYHPTWNQSTLTIPLHPQSKSKIFLLCWCPDTAAIKKKMLYSSRLVKSQDGIFTKFHSFDTLKRAFVGVHKIIQANDQSDVRHNSYMSYDLISPHLRSRRKRWKTSFATLTVTNLTILLDCGLCHMWS